MATCRSCDGPTERTDEVCDDCWRDPATNSCTECGDHLEGINYPYVCGPCVSAPRERAEEIFAGLDEFARWSIRMGGTAFTTYEDEGDDVCRHLRWLVDAHFEAKR